VNRFAAVILAAGYSSRMGQLKPLLTIGGETIADHLISTFQTCGVDVYLVVGYRGQEVKAAIKKRDITIVDNPDYALGMFGSVQTGVRTLNPGYDAFFIMPVDIPMVSAKTIRSLQAAFSEHPGKIVYPVFGSKRGHPPLVPISLAAVIAGWKQEGSLNKVLRSYENLAVEIAVPDENILLDIDTKADFRLLLERSKQHHLQ